MSTAGAHLSAPCGTRCLECGFLRARQSPVRSERTNAFYTTWRDTGDENTASGALTADGKQTEQWRHRITVSAATLPTSRYGGDASSCIASFAKHTRGATGLARRRPPGKDPQATAWRAHPRRRAQ